MISQGEHQDNKESHGTIELRVEEISQLFDNLDPFPFRERDLDKDAEAYIVGWARELPRRQALKLVVHLPASEAAKRQANELGEAMKRYFASRADAARLELKELFRVGRRSLYIGVCVLAGCMLLGQVVAGRLGTGYVGRFVEESLIILGWVANWKPIEIMLYDWLPLKRRFDLYGRLSRAEVILRPFEGTMRPNPF